MREYYSILSMSEPHLSALLAVVLPGRHIEEVTKEEMQEMCIKWLFVNGLSLNHHFQFESDSEGELFVVMSGRKSCDCCPAKDFDNPTLSSFDRSPFGSHLAVYQCDQGGTVSITVPDHSRERRNSVGNRLDNRSPDPQMVKYTRTKSDSTVNGFSTVYGPDDPPSYAPPPPPTERALNERRSQKISPITTQPRPANPKKEKKEERKKDEGFCHSCYRECGSCCMGLCSNFSL